VAAVEKEIAQIAARAEQAIAEVRQIAFVRSLETPVGAWMSASPKMRARRR
jgi:cytidylate kinase